MAWKQTCSVNKKIQYICVSTDDKLAGDIGSRLYESNTSIHYINTDGTATGWVEYKTPEAYTTV